MTSTQLPVHRVRTAVGHEAWLFTDYARVRELLDDDRLGRSHREPATAARTGDSALFGGRWATSTPRPPTTPGCGRCCSPISRPNTYAR